MLKKLLISLGTMALAASLVGSSAVFGGTDSSSPGTPTIALVNEDQPASFNGVSYLFGKEFVSLVSNDATYNWEVVSRSVAERAYADKSVSAVIHLPGSFSHDVLTLQDLNPVTAVIDYKIVKGDALSQERLENQVNTILRDFNTRIVKMYFASIAGNISGAQANMGSAVASQASLVDSLSTTLYPDLDRSAQGYGSSVSLAGILQSMNSAWISTQNSFTDSTTRTLTSVSEALNRQQPSLSDYFAQQEQIARTNVSNGNGAISDQAASDKSFYDREFSSHIDGLLSGDGTWSGFDGFSSVDADGTASGVLASLESAVAGYDRLASDFNTRVDGVGGTLRDQQEALTASVFDLEALETSLLKEYFGVTMPADNASIGVPAGDDKIGDATYDIDTSTLTVDLAKPALAQKVAESFSTRGSSTATTVGMYEQRVSDLLATIPTNAAEYSALFSALQGTSAFDPAAYLSNLAMIRQYDDTHGIVPPALNLVYPSTGVTTQSVTKTVPITVAAGTRSTVSIRPPSTIPLTDVTISLGSPAPSCPALTPSCVWLDQAAGSATVDNRKGDSPITVTLAFGIDLMDAAGTTTIAYTAQDTTSTPPAAETSIGSDVYVLVPANATKEKIGGDDFAAISTYLGNIQTAAHLLQFLFGAPGDTLDTFTSALRVTGDFGGHSTESVYNRYGTIDTSQIEENLSDTDVWTYLNLGRDNISAIITQITGMKAQLQAIAGNLDTLSGLQLSDTYFSDTVSRLQAWYAAAIASVNASPAQWEQKANAVIQLDTLPWHGQKEGRSELYLDEDTGPALYRTLSELVAATSHDAQNVAAGAQIIADNSAQFDALVAGVERTKADTQAVLDAMKGTIATGNTDLSTNSDYSKRFSTVLSNTRASGADPEKIYESFANPVTTKATTPATAAVTDAFDYRWLVVFVAGSLIGALLCYLTIRRNARSREAK